MKDDIRLVESDARTLDRDTYQNFMESFQNGYKEEITSEEFLPDHYEDSIPSCD